LTSNITYLDESAAAGCEHTLYAFLAEKERRSGSKRTVQSYSRMLHDFFGRCGKTPDEVTSTDVFAWGYGRGLSGQEPSSTTIGAHLACLSSSSAGHVLQRPDLRGAGHSSQGVPLRHSPRLGGGSIQRRGLAGPARLRQVWPGGQILPTQPGRGEKAHCCRWLPRRAGYSGALWNRFIAELVFASRSASDCEVSDAQALPSRRRAGSWWPAAVEAYACLRVGDIEAPFFIAWDRAAAPAFHRRKRVSAWHAFRGQEHPLGDESAPPVVALSAGSGPSSQWERFAVVSAERRGEPLLPAAITEVDAVFSADPLDAIWREPGRSRNQPLAEVLTWRRATADEPQLPLLDRVASLRATTGPLEALSRTHRSSSLPAHRNLGVSDIRILDWLGFHPLLTASDLATLTRLGTRQAEGVLERLRANSLIDALERPVGPACSTVYYYVSGRGLDVLAAREGVPSRRYLHHGSIAADVPGWRGDGRLATLVREFEHTTGVNRFFVQFIEDASRHGALVIRWVGPSEAAQGFDHAGGGRAGCVPTERPTRCLRTGVAVFSSNGTEAPCAGPPWSASSRFTVPMPAQPRSRAGCTVSSCSSLHAAHSGRRRFASARPR
jgi:hypothetical protein